MTGRKRGGEWEGERDDWVTTLLSGCSERLLNYASHFQRREREVEEEGDSKINDEHTEAKDLNTAVSRKHTTADRGMREEKKNGLIKERKGMRLGKCVCVCEIGRAHV